MPDLTDSFGKILDTGIVGALCLILIGLLVYREQRYWPKIVDEWKAKVKEVTDAYTAEIRDERAKHDKTRDALLEEVRSNGETIALVRTQMSNQQSAFEALVGVVRKDAA